MVYTVFIGGCIVKVKVIICGVIISFLGFGSRGEATSAVEVGVTKF